jgi:hypothetical protein
MYYYITYLLERDLKSTEFLQRLRREMRGSSSSGP